MLKDLLKRGKLGGNGMGDRSRKGRKAAQQEAAARQLSGQSSWIERSVRRGLGSAGCRSSKPYKKDDVLVEKAETRNRDHRPEANTRRDSTSWQAHYT